jgi:hypothetical protein
VEPRVPAGSGVWGGGKRHGSRASKQKIAGCADGGLMHAHMHMNMDVHMLMLPAATLCFCERSLS